MAVKKCLPTVFNQKRSTDIGVETKKMNQQFDTLRALFKECLNGMILSTLIFGVNLSEIANAKCVTPTFPKYSAQILDNQRNVLAGAVHIRGITGTFDWEKVEPNVYVKARFKGQVTVQLGAAEDVIAQSEVGQGSEDHVALLQFVRVPSSASTSPPTPPAAAQALTVHGEFVDDGSFQEVTDDHYVLDPSRNSENSRNLKKLRTMLGNSNNLELWTYNKGTMTLFSFVRDGKQYYFVIPIVKKLQWDLKNLPPCNDVVRD